MIFEYAFKSIESSTLNDKLITANGHIFLLDTS